MDFVAVDIETTGFSHVYDSIIQIGAVKIVNNQIAGEFNCYIQTTKRIPPVVVETTGITNEILREKGVPYYKALTEFCDFIGDMDMVAHNASFDYRFLERKIQYKLKKLFRNKHYCTMQLCKKKLPELPNHRLDTICSHFGLLNIKHHDALNDAKMCADITLKLAGHEPVFTLNRPKSSSNNTSLADAFIIMKKNRF